MLGRLTAAALVGLTGLVGAVGLSSGIPLACQSASIDLTALAANTAPIGGYGTSQLTQAAILMNAATAQQLPAAAELVAVTAAIARTGLGSTAAAGVDGLGVLGLPDTGWGDEAARQDAATAAAVFYVHLTAVDDWQTLSPAAAAEAVLLDLPVSAYMAATADAAEIVDGLTQRAGAGQCAPRAAGNDYPWANATIDVMSPLGYGIRECTDFVAWRLNRDAGATGAPWTYRWGQLTPLGGNAIDWKANWVSHGWTTSTTPVPGAVAWWGTRGGPNGHVAYVQAVNDDGTVVLEEYNWGGTHQYDTRTVPVTAPDLYLYPPPRS